MQPKHELLDNLDLNAFDGRTLFIGVGILVIVTDQQCIGLTTTVKP
jgi:hypothetical protein